MAKDPRPPKNTGRPKKNGQKPQKAKATILPGAVSMVDGSGKRYTPRHASPDSIDPIDTDTQATASHRPRTRTKGPIPRYHADSVDPIDQPRNINHRDTGYMPAYADHALRVLALGIGKKGLASYFGVKVETIDQWAESHPSFEQILRKGLADSSSKVVHALYKRAVGYEYEPKGRILTDQNNCPLVDPVTGEERRAYRDPIYYPPDVAAAQAWLKAHYPDTWGVGPGSAGNTAMNVALTVTNEARNRLLEIFNANASTPPEKK